MRRHSLLFGIQAYPDTGTLTPLKCPHADVDALAEVLQDPVYMGEVGQVVVKKDVTFPEAQKAFGDFLREVGREDVVIIHFSGHGIKDDDGDLYLCFSDAVETELHFTALNVKTFGEWLEKQRLRRMLITLDCCYSGAAGALMTRSGPAAPLKSAERPRPDGTGLYILSSAGATETAKEGNGRGIFSHHLVEGIRTGAADTNEDGEITVSEIADYLHRKVPQDAAQTPFMTAHKASGTFLVAQNPVPLEREAARRAAEAAAAARATREATLSAGLDKVKQHVSFGSFGLGFGGEVERWIVGQRASADAGEPPQLALLAKLAEGRFSAVEFHDQWREADRADDAAEQAAAREAAAREQAERESAQKAEEERAARERIERQRVEWEAAEAERRCSAREAESQPAQQKAAPKRHWLLSLLLLPFWPWRARQREPAKPREAAPETVPRKKRRWLRWLFYIFVVYFILVIVAAILNALSTPTYY